MKRAILILTVLAVCVTSMPSFAQEAEPQMFMVLTHPMIPGKVELHLESMGGIVKLHKQHGFKFPFSSYVSDSFNFYALLWMDSTDDISKAMEEIGRVAMASGDEWVKYSDMEVESMESYSFSIYQYQPDLSYHPEPARIADDEATFRRWTMISIKIGSEAVVNGIMKDFVSLYEKKGIKDGFSVSVSVFDRDMPVYVFVEHGKDAGDFYTQDGKNIGIIGEEGKVLWDKLTPHIRKIESEHITYLPELSMTE